MLTLVWTRCKIKKIDKKQQEQAAFELVVVRGRVKTEDIDDLGLMGCQTTSPPFVKARL